MEKEFGNRFTHYPPINNIIRQNHEEVRNKIQDVARSIKRVVPPGREQSLAITKLEEAMFWANAGIARNQEAQ